MEGLLKEIQKSKTSKRKVSFNEEGTNECEDAIDEAIAQEEQQTPSQLPTKELQYDPIDIESIDMVDFWVTEEVVEKEPDLSSNIEDLLDEIDADLDQGGGGGGSSSIFYVAPLAFSGPSSGNEGDDINDANLHLH
ncbi:hypothetical protein Ahy_B03g063287 isoform A [Arachis hypogaea]|uniref:Uncharacterized protein n=1 Tax=Arachis hypogaea TaxID=3818 RepID=A0A444ZWS0_ARAHY|nr:hypothetical protein Ahy_B03g063287 isoform A [Arachis hypogaea]